jgi:hypothetical protein
MGYNTVVLVLNDASSAIENNAQDFASGVVRAMSNFKETTVSLGNHGNPVTVMPTFHANSTKFFCAGGNSIYEITNFNDDFLNKLKHSQYLRKSVKEDLKTLKERVKDLEKLMKEMESEN